MATIFKYEDAEEFYAEFVRVEGERGIVVLIFPSEDEQQDMALAESIAKIIDGVTGEEG